MRQIWFIINLLLCLPHANSSIFHGINFLFKKFGKILFKIVILFLVCYIYLSCIQHNNVILLVNITPNSNDRLYIPISKKITWGANEKNNNEDVMYWFTLKITTKVACYSYYASEDVEISCLKSNEILPPVPNVRASRQKNAS